MNLPTKYWLAAETVLILVCISFFIEHSRNVKEDLNLEEKFNREHRTEILQIQHQRSRDEYDFSIEEAQNDFYYELMYLEINYKRDIGELTMDEWSNEMKEIVDEEIEDSKADLDSYIAALDEIEVIEYVTSDELSGRIRRSKVLSRVSLVLVLVIGVVTIIKNW
ncbi:MAG: hypothetical protein JXP36_18985 [Bacteroidales bacterium]|nr:hypothetical protein [Bacteroidales bacterium]